MQFYLEVILRCQGSQGSDKQVLIFKIIHSENYTINQIKLFYIATAHLNLTQVVCDQIIAISNKSIHFSILQKKTN